MQNKDGYRASHELRNVLTRTSRCQAFTEKATGREFVIVYNRENTPILRISEVEVLSPGQDPRVLSE